MGRLNRPARYRGAVLPLLLLLVQLSGVLLYQALNRQQLLHQQAVTDSHLQRLQRVAVSALHQAAADYLASGERHHTYAFAPVGTVTVHWHALTCPEFAQAAEQANGANPWPTGVTTQPSAADLGTSLAADHGHASPRDPMLCWQLHTEPGWRHLTVSRQLRLAVQGQEAWWW